MTASRRAAFFSIPRPPIRSVPMLIALTLAYPAFQASRTLDTTIRMHAKEAQAIANLPPTTPSVRPAAAPGAQPGAVATNLSADAMRRAFASVERLSGPNPKVLKIVLTNTGRASAVLKVDSANTRSVFSDDAAHEVSTRSNTVPAEANVRWSMLDPAAPGRMVAAAASLGVPPSALQTLTFGPYDQQGAPGLGWRGIWTAVPEPLVITADPRAERPVRQP